MSVFVLLIALLLSAIFCEILDGLPDFFLAGLHGFKWIGFGVVLVVLAGLLAER